MSADSYREHDDEEPPVAGRRRRFARAESESDTYDDFVSDGEEGPAGRFRLMRVLIAVLALVAFAGVTWYAYNWGIASREPQELVVIQAEATPEKERPAEEGGLTVPHRDKLLLNDVAPDNPQPKIERLLPPPETPKPPVEAAEPADVEPPQSQSESVVPPSEPSQEAGDATGDTATAEVRSLVVREAETADQETAAEQVESSAAVPSPPPSKPLAETETEPPAPQVPAAPATTAAAPVSQAPASQGAASKAPAQTAQVQAVAGSFYLQLASVKSHGAATREWARLQKQYPSLLGRQSLTVEQAEVKGTQYHRVQTGAFAQRDDAANLCAKLKAGGQDCLVRKR